MSERKILIIRNAAPYDFGGGERFPIFLAQTLEDQGFSPVIVSRSQKLLSFAQNNKIPSIKGWWWAKQQWSGIHNLFIPLYAVWQVVLTSYYSSLFKRLRPTAVHIQSKDDFIAATRAAKKIGIRVIWTDHADLKHIWQNLSVWYKNPIGKMVYKAAANADSITLVSKSELNLISSRIPKDSPIHQKFRVIYNGVLDNATNQPSKDGDPFTYLVASRLVKDKGIQEVIDAFTSLHEKYANTRLQVIGDGPDGELFERAAMTLPAIELLGHQNQPLDFMAKADTFVHPTYHEGFSVALVEAGMMSLPIIATAVGGNVEIIKDGETGLLVQPKSSRELLDAMEKLYKNKVLRDKLARNARMQYISRFQFNNIVKENFIPLYGGV